VSGKVPGLQAKAWFELSVALRRGLTGEFDIFSHLALNTKPDAWACNRPPDQVAGRQGALLRSGSFFLGAKDRGTRPLSFLLLVKDKGTTPPSLILKAVDRGKRRPSFILKPVDRGKYRHSFILVADDEGNTPISFIPTPQYARG
jgi:hypothetical protein